MRLLIFLSLLLITTPAVSSIKTLNNDTEQKAQTISVYFSPDKSNEKTVVEYINGAENSLDIAAYSLTNAAIANAIKNVRANGITVRLLCDRGQAAISRALCRESSGKVDKKSGLMHNKFIVRDERCVLTGSFNFTDNAVYRNRENFVILCHGGVAETYHNEFNKLWKENT